MAGPSGRAYGPPKGMLVPATHDWPCDTRSPAQSSWPGVSGPPVTAGAGTGALARSNTPGHDDRADKGKRHRQPAYDRHQPGGGLNPIHTRSSKAATAIVVRSPWIGPAICTPSGSPAFVTPIGATVPGRWYPPVSPGQNSMSLYAISLPSMLIRRSQVAPS